jgi:hypothetical protein
MRRCNPRRVLPINMCDRHECSNIRTTMKTPTHLGHPVCRRASAVRTTGLRNHRPQRSCTGRGQIRFLGSDLRDCSLTSSNSSPRLITSSSVTRRGSSPSMRTSLGRSPSSSDHHRQGTVCHVWFLLSNHVLHI